MKRLHASPDAAQQEPETARVSPSTPTYFAMAPRSIITDQTISAQAFRLWALLDSRQGQHAQNQVRQSVLATDLGLHPRTVKRLVAELVNAGYLTVRQTKGTAFSVIHNPARDRTQKSPQEAQKGQESHPRSDRNGTFIEQELPRNKKASKQVRESVTEGPETIAAATASVAQELAKALPSTDPLTREAFLSALPSHLRPADTARVSSLIAAALARGWTATGLAQAVGKEVPNPNAGPGMAVTALATLSQQPPREHLQQARSREWADFLPGPYSEEPYSPQPPSPAPALPLDNVPTRAE